MNVVRFELDQEDAEALLELAGRGLKYLNRPTSAHLRALAYVDVQTRLGAVAEATT